MKTKGPYRRHGERKDDTDALLQELDDLRALVRSMTAAVDVNWQQAEDELAALRARLRTVEERAEQAEAALAQREQELAEAYTHIRWIGEYLKGQVDKLQERDDLDARLTQLEQEMRALLDSDADWRETYPERDTVMYWADTIQAIQAVRMGVKE